MIKAEIRVGLNTYLLHFPGVTDMQEAWEHANAVATGQTIHKGPDGWLDLNTGKYDHIRVWEAVDVFQPSVGVPEVEDIEPAAPYFGTRVVPHLGQKVKMQVAIYYSEGTYYVMPYKLNDNPAADMLGKEGLQELVKQYAVLAGMPQDHTEAVLPHGIIADDEEALAFVMDYAVETEIQRERLLQDIAKTAKAFSWKKENE